MRRAGQAEVSRTPSGFARRLMAAGLAAVLLGAACETPGGGSAAPAPKPAPQPQPSSIELGQSGDAAFDAWRRSFAERARSEGRSGPVIASVLRDLAPLEQRVQPARDQQAEFVKPIWDYARTAVSETRIANGRARLQELAPVFDRLEGQYAAPRDVLAAIWGMESAFGANIGNIDAAQALATQAAAGRRVEFNEGELIALMRLIETGVATRDQFRRASWAGAVGQTQFMPSSLLQYGRDFEGDGRIDVWNNPADALAAAANYLTAFGWRKGEPALLEVQLPPGFDYGQADGTRLSLGDWRTRGLEPAPGLVFNDPALAAELFLPAGMHGPAFLLFHNFGVIKRYNNADSYAMGVALLAQRLGGGPALFRPWPADLPALTLDEAKQLQTALNALGYSAGNADGIIGRGTRAAVQRFQKERGLPADGYPTREIFAAVLAAAPR
jgi:membrane-bound lytic murein transglycosylase B